jgi:hypothetical protein
LNQITAITLAANVIGTANNFAELGAKAQFVSIRSFLASTPGLAQFLSDLVAKGTTQTGGQAGALVQPAAATTAAMTTAATTTAATTSTSTNSAASAAALVVRAAPTAAQDDDESESAATAPAAIPTISAATAQATTTASTTTTTVAAPAAPLSSAIVSTYTAAAPFLLPDVYLASGATTWMATAASAAGRGDSPSTSSTAAHATAPSLVDTLLADPLKQDVAADATPPTVDGESADYLFGGDLEGLFSPPGDDAEEAFWDDLVH